MVPFNMGYLAGFLANKYNVSAKDNEHRALERMAVSVAQDFRNTISGYASVRALSEHTGTVHASHTYALYPVYVLNTSWQGKNYLFAMNGQTGKFVGNLPFSMAQAVKYFVPIAAITSLISFIIYYVFL